MCPVSSSLPVVVSKFSTKARVDTPSESWQSQKNAGRFVVCLGHSITVIITAHTSVYASLFWLCNDTVGVQIGLHASARVSVAVW